MELERIGFKGFIFGIEWLVTVFPGIPLHYGMAQNPVLMIKSAFMKGLVEGPAQLLPSFAERFEWLGEKVSGPRC